MKNATALLLDDNKSLFDNDSAPSKQPTIIPSRLTNALKQCGLSIICHLHNKQGLMNQIEIHNPELIVLDVFSPDQEVLEILTLLQQHNPKPIIIFSEECKSEITPKVLKAGVSAFIVDGYNPKRFKSIVEIALARFQQQQAQIKELQSVKNQLADRKIIDRAKGLLMKSKKLDEEQAYSAMRKMAMDQGQSMINIARNIIAVMELMASDTF